MGFVLIMFTKLFLPAGTKQAAWNLLSREVPLHSAKTTLNGSIVCLLTVHHTDICEKDYIGCVCIKSSCCYRHDDNGT